MPARDKHRDLVIKLQGDTFAEAVVMWVQQYHGIEIDHKDIDIEYDEQTKKIKSITVVKKAPDEPKQKPKPKEPEVISS